MLAVVQDQQLLLCCERLHPHVTLRTIHESHTERFGDALRNGICVGIRKQLDKPNSVAKFTGKLVRGLDGQPCLSDSARSRYGHEAMVDDLLAQSAQCFIAPYEAAQSVR